MRLTLQILQVISCLALVLIVLFQSGSKEGLGFIGGAAESFVSKNKAKSLDAKLQKWTIVIAVVFAALTIVLNLPGISG